MKITAFCFLLAISLLTGTSEAAPLTLGATISGQLSQPGALDSYTFTGTPGQRVIYDALDTDSLSMNARLKSPSQTILWERNSRSDVEPFTLIESGTYTLEVQGNGATTGGYHFRLLDIASQPALPLGTTVSKTLDPGNSVQIYTLDGFAGDRYFFDGQGANNTGTQWYLYSPNNQVVPNGQAGIGADFEVTLPEDGTYALVLWGSSSTPLPYLFQVGALTVKTNALTLGATVSGNITNPGDQQWYTFTGTPGQRLIYDALTAPDSLQINMRILNPEGTNIKEINSRSDTDPFTLTESGTYTLVIDGIGATVGAYEFRLLDVAAQPALPLGTVVNKTLDPGDSVDVYDFTGAAGQRLYFHGMGANSGTSWYLYGPNGQSITGAGIGADFEVVLSLNGPYFVVVWGSSPTPLAYSVEVFSAATTTTPLALGAVVSGAIAKPGDQQLYTFTGTPGQRIYYDALDRNFPQIYTRLLSPSGAVVWDLTNQSTDIGPRSLLEAGTYTLVIDGSAATTGNFTFRILDLASAPVLSLTTRTSGQLNPSSATDAYLLVGVAGQRLNFKSVSASVNQADWRLEGPANQDVAVSGSITTDLGDVVLPTTGSYWLLVEGNADSLTPLSYQFDATDHSDTPVAVSGLGDVRNGNLTTGQQDVLTFTAPAGLWVYFNSQDHSAVNLTAELLDPTGTRVFFVGAYADSGPYVLPRSGSYKLTISGTGGTFKYRLMDWSNGAAPLTLNSTVTATLDPYRTDVYQFQGQAAQRLVYDALENDFANVSVRLITPDGQARFINGNSDSDVGPFTLTVPGTYYLVFESNLATPASYTARLLDVASAPALQFQTALSPNINPGLGIVLYTINTTAGEFMSFYGQVSNAGGTWALYGPNNAGLGGGGGLNSYFEVPNPPTGTCVLLLSGSSANPITPAFEAYTPRSGAQPGQPRITSISSFGGTTILVWDAIAGKAYRVQYIADLTQTSWSDLAGDVTATGVSATKTDNSGGNAPQRFFRIEVLP